MGIIARKFNLKNTNYNQLKGSGLFQRGSICTLSTCIPQPLSVPKAPVPKLINRTPPVSLVATKQSSKNNKWVLSGIHYPTFNSLWVNIPRGSFTILKING